MAMEARLSLRQSQRVVMTPLLQQAIQLLQLSTLELQEVVQKELLENPLLEEVAPETENAAEAPASPEAQNHESKTGPGDGSPNPRWSRAFGEWRLLQDPENCAERRGLCNVLDCSGGGTVQTIEAGWQNFPE